MHYTQALELIRKYTGITDLKQMPLEGVWKNKNSYVIDDKENIVGLNLRGNKLQNIDFIKDFISLGILDFSENQVQDVSPLKSLTNLIGLGLSNNQVTDISPLKVLTQLCGLFVSANKIQDIYPLQFLTQLESLDFSANKIQDIYPLQFLTNLTGLWFSENQITNILPLKDLTNLVNLSFLENQVTDISPLKDLTKLERLYFGSNQVTDISPLKDLTKLERLNFYVNQVTDISLLKGLIKLEKLNFWKNQVTDISALQNLTKLEELEFSLNQVTDISPLKDLTKLRELDFSNNQVTDISPLKNLTNLKELELENNPVKGIPLEYTKQSKVLGIAFGKSNIQKIQEYYSDLEKQSSYVIEAKMVLVGEPAAGKTSLGEKLRNPDYKLKTGSQEEIMTKGIVVSEWLFPYTNPKNTPLHEGFDGNFKAHIFDFGGQDIMHATHRYFLSKRTLYVLVIDTRKEDTDFHYWLSIIELFGEKSPVIVVLNKKHDIYKEVPQHIVEQFAHLIGDRIYTVNLRNNEGLADLSERIKYELQSLPHVGTERHPKTWVDVRQALHQQWANSVWDKIQIWKNTKDKKHYLSRQEYLDLCQNIGIGQEEKALQIAETLHTLGTILYFQDNDALLDTIILNKHWATEAVYLVLLDEEVRRNYGKFASLDYRRIWKEKYPIEKHNALIALMLAFKIAYQVPNTDSYIAPQLLSENPPAGYEKLFTNTEYFTHFEYHYAKFMPKGLLSRLIVEMHRKIYQGFQWRYGVVLEIHDSLVEITEHRYGSVQKIAIRAKGKEALKAMSVVLDKMTEIHDEFPNLYYQEMIPCNCVECKTAPYFFRYETLKKAQEKGKTELDCQKSFEKAKILELLEGFNYFKNQIRYDFLRTCIDENNMSNFYEELDKIGISENQLSQLRQEFIWEGGDFKYPKRLKVWLLEYFKRKKLGC